MKIERLPDGVEAVNIPEIPKLSMMNMEDEARQFMECLATGEVPPLGITIRKIPLDLMQGGCYRWGRDEQTDTLFISRVK